MRDYQGRLIGIGRDHPDTATQRELKRVWDQLAMFHYWAKEASRGFGRITQGEVPTGSGDPLSGPTFDGSPYFYLPGRAGGQVGYGGTAASDSLQLISTVSTTPGKIIFGAASATVYDELHDRLGINTASPGAKLDIRQTGTTASTVPTSTTGLAGWANEDTSAASLDRIAKTSVNDATYLIGSAPGTDRTNLPNITPQASTATIVVQARFAWAGSDAGSGGTFGNFELQDGGGNVVHTSGNQLLAAVHANVPTPTFVTYSFTLTPTEIAGITSGGGWNGMRLFFGAAGGGTGYNGNYYCSLLNLQIVGATAVDLVDLYDLNAVLRTWVNSDATLNASALVATGVTATTVTAFTASASGLAASAIRMPTGAVAGYFVKSADAAGNFQWAQISEADFLTPVSAISANTTATTAQDVLLASGSLTVLLYTAATAGHTLNVKNTGSGTVTVSASGGQTIDGATTMDIVGQNNSMMIVSDGSNWKIV